MTYPDILPVLHRLDQLLAGAVAAAEKAYGPTAASDPYRGLRLEAEEVARSLDRQPGASPLAAHGAVPAVPTPAAVINRAGNGSAGTPPSGSDLFGRWRQARSTAAHTIGADAPGAGVVPAAPPAADRSALAGDHPRLTWLARAFGLSAFDLDVVVIALAPEVDLRYERLYAYLQDDVTRRRPSVDLALNLLCATAEDKLARRAHFGSDGPLSREGIVAVIPDPAGIRPPLLASFLKLDEQLTRLVLDEPGLDSRLTSFCSVAVPGADGVAPGPAEPLEDGLVRLVGRAIESGERLHLYLRGGPGAGKRQTAERLAHTAGAPVLVVDLVRALDAPDGFEAAFHRARREAWLSGAFLYLQGLDALRGRDAGPGAADAANRLMSLLAEPRGPAVTILAGAGPWVPAGDGPAGVVTVALERPDFARRLAVWRTDLAGTGVPEATIVDLAARFRLGERQIADAVATARRGAERRSGDVCEPTAEDLFRAARAQSGHDLAALTIKMTPLYSWDDIVLPEDALAQLREIGNRVAQRHRVFADWGFERKLSLGKGVNVLFAGPSGTGKTMAAEILARELGLDMYKIDLSGVVSKYIGETEKNLDRIFAAAEEANAILFFDEADALFGKRSEVRDSHDRYANIEIAYLLQKMELYDGMTVLATNLRQNLDDAFTRRLAFTVHFPLPDEASRLRIWSGVWPAEAPLGGDVSLDLLARQLKLSGGNIKNIALAAAFQAAASGGDITMTHVLQAARREYQKMGKTLGPAEFEAFALGAVV